MTDEGLAIGDVAQGFWAVQLPQAEDLDSSSRGQGAALVIYVSMGWGACRELLPGIMRGWDEWTQESRIALVCEGDDAAVRNFAAETGVSFPIFADPGAAIRANYGNPSTPHAFLVGQDGTIRLKGIVISRDDVDRLLGGQARRLGGRQVVADPISERVKAVEERMSCKESRDDVLV